MLIKAGADPNARENYGFTPLHEAAENGNLDVLKYLIKVGGNPSIALIKSYDIYKVGDTPLEIAQKAKKENVVNYLSKMKKTPKKKDK